MGKHSRNETADNSDTRAGGDTMGKHETSFHTKSEHRATEIVKRLHTRKGSDLAGMDTGE